MTARAEKLGQIFRDGVTAFKTPIVQLVRGKGLLNAVVIDESSANGRSAWDLCILLKEKGLLVSSISWFCPHFGVELQTAFSACLHRLACRYHPTVCRTNPRHARLQAEHDNETSGY